MRKRILSFCMGVVFLLLSSEAVLADTLCLPSNLVIVDAEAFAYDALIREVVLPEGTQRIESKAFANSSLTRIYLPTSLKYIAPDAFEGSSQVLTAWGRSNAVFARTYCAEHNIQFEYDKSDESEEEATTMKMMIGVTTVPVEWEDNESVVALKALCPLTISMSMYGGFEQVGSIGATLPRNDKQTTTSSGDIVLYSGNQLVVFYGSNSWAYTRLGHIDLSRQEMSALLSNGNVTITLE